MEPKIVGNRIKKLMNIKNIKEKELMDSLEITMSELEKKLNGQEEFYLGEIMKIKELFHLNLDVFAKLFFEKDFDFDENWEKSVK